MKFFIKLILVAVTVIHFYTRILNVKLFLKRVSFIAILEQASHFCLKFGYIILTP